jgi:hypothetical protein
VSQIDFQITRNQPLRINFRPSEGTGFELTFAAAMLHGFCGLFKKAVANADWDMEVHIPGALETGTQDRVLN